MDSKNHETLLQLSEAAILVFVDDNSTVIAEQNKDNKSYINAATGVLPHRIVLIMAWYFYIYLQCHRERHDYPFSIDDIYNIGRQNKEFFDAYNRKTELKISIYSFDDGGAYWDAWKRLHNMHSVLERFFGNLMTILTSTSTDDRAFLVVKY